LDIVRGSDAALATLAGLAALAVYLRTIAPDLSGWEDTPKFQYLGSVLGTAHPPGYPLHSLLSYVFSWIPIGTIAFRANLLSACSGALAVALGVRLARALGIGRIAAVAGAWTIAFSLTFWRYSVLAEVYTLAAALLAAVIYWMIRWDATRRPRHLYYACIAFALALGNHLSIVATAPGILWFLWKTRARSTLTFRRVVLAGVLVFSGMLQYGLVWLRTVQNADYVEARATNIDELFGVVRATQFEGYVWGYSLREMLTERIPALVTVLRTEIGIVGILACIAGIVFTVRRDWRAGGLIAIAFGSVTVFVTNIKGDLAGFMVPPLALAAVFLAATGDELLRRLAQAPSRALATAGAVALLLVPAVALRANFSTNDWSRRTEDAEYFRALLAMMPQKFGFIEENYETDQRMAYMLATEGAGRYRDLIRPNPTAVGRLFDEGTPVFAFEGGQARLGPAGLDFEPLEILGPTLGEVLGRVPSGSRIALAGVGQGPPVDVIRALGLERLIKSYGQPPPMQALVATAGAPDDTTWEQQHEVATVSVTIDRSPDAGGGQPVPFVATADHEAAIVTLGERVLAIVDRGFVASVLDRNGRVQGIYVARPPDYRIVRPQPGHQVFHLKGKIPVQPVGDRKWHDVTSVTGDGSLFVRIDNFRAYDAHAILYATDDGPMRPQLGMDPHGTGKPEIEVRAFDRNVAADVAALADSAIADGLSLDALGPGRHVARVILRVNDGGDYSASLLSLGAVPSRVLATGETDLVNPLRVVLFSRPSTRLLSRQSVDLAGMSEYFETTIGAGWHRSSRDPDGGFRWTAAREARLVLSIAPAEHASMLLRMRVPDPPNGNGGTTPVEISLNGKVVGVCQVRPAWESCRLALPAGVLVEGGNELTFRTPDLRPLPPPGPGPAHHYAQGVGGVAVRWIRLRRG
jgi:hypothetical protein